MGRPKISEDFRLEKLLEILPDRSGGWSIESAKEFYKAAKETNGDFKQIAARLKRKEGNVQQFAQELKRAAKTGKYPDLESYFRADRPCRPGKMPAKGN